MTKELLEHEDYVINAFRVFNKLMQHKGGAISYKLEENLFALYLDDQIIGRILFKIDGEKMNIQYSRVNLAYRGQGYGKILYAGFAFEFNRLFASYCPCIARTFISEVSYSLAKWCIEERLLSPSTWNDKYIEIEFDSSSTHGDVIVCTSTPQIEWEDDQDDLPFGAI